MNLRALALLSIPLIPCTGCGNGQVSDEAPYAFASGVSHVPVDGGIRPSGVALPPVQIAANLAATPASVAAEETEGVLGLSAVAALVSALTARGHVLDVTKTPEAVTAALAAAALVNLCSSVNMTYQTNTAYITVDFGTGCKLAGSSVTTSGKILVGVTGSSSGAPWSAVAVTFSGLGINGRTADGYATMSTGGGGYTLISRIALGDMGIVSFNGAFTGDASGASLDGSGMWTGVAKPADVASADGWACSASGGSALDLHNVHKSPASCFADGGSIAITQPYACTKRADAGTPEKSTFLSLASVSFLPTTPGAGKVTVTITGPHAAMDGGASVTVAVPSDACSRKTQ